MMFTRSAEIYDAIYRFKDCAVEADDQELTGRAPYIGVKAVE